MSSILKDCPLCGVKEVHCHPVDHGHKFVFWCVCVQPICLSRNAIKELANRSGEARKLILHWARFAVRRGKMLEVTYGLTNRPGAPFEILWKEIKRDTYECID